MLLINYNNDDYGSWFTCRHCRSSRSSSGCGHHYCRCRISAQSFTAAASPLVVHAAGAAATAGETSSVRDATTSRVGATAAPESGRGRVRFFDRKVHRKVGTGAPRRCMCFVIGLRCHMIRRWRYYLQVALDTVEISLRFNCQ